MMLMIIKSQDMQKFNKVLFGQRNIDYYQVLTSTPIFYPLQQKSKAPINLVQTKK